MIIKESAENYLESILVIKSQKGFVRSIDIAKDLEVSKTSVCVAMKNFREGGYITVEEDGNIDLTSKGYEIASRVSERHEVISRALMSLGVSEDVALSDSCKIEHCISAAKELNIRDFSCDSSLYRHVDGKYYLILNSKYVQNTTHIDFISEFGDISNSENAFLMLTEYGKCILKENAIGLLSEI